MKYPKGGSYAVSEDGIHFTKSHDIFTDDENPSPFRMDDGRVGIIHSGFSADKGWFAADRLAGPWSLVDDKVPTAGDCPCPFSWNGWHYVIQGFVTMAGSPSGKPGTYEDWVLSGDDVYGGLSVPMVADWTNGRKIRGLDRPFKVRLNLYYDPKADGTVFDAEIAGTRTMVARSAGRYTERKETGK